jgi:hypothetical protein
MVQVSCHWIEYITTIKSTQQMVKMTRYELRYVPFALFFLENTNHCTSKTSLFFGTVEPDTSWDIITSVDLWEDGGSDDGYVLVKQEDVVDGMTSFMAACLVSIKKTKVAVFFT